MFRNSQNLSRTRDKFSFERSVDCFKIQTNQFDEVTALVFAQISHASFLTDLILFQKTPGYFEEMIPGQLIVELTREESSEIVNHPTATSDTVLFPS